MTFIQGFGMHVARLGFTPEMRLRTYRDLAARLEAGLPLADALGALQAAPAPGPRGRALGDWRAKVAAGLPFSAAVAGWVPKSDRMILKASEEAGDVLSGILNAEFLAVAGRQVRVAFTVEFLRLAFLAAVAAAGVAAFLHAR